MSGIQKLTRSAGVVGGSTLVSRLTGLVRDMVMAKVFGATMVADAFYVAFMIPNLFRRLVGEGSLTVAFIPVFTKFRQEEGEEAALRLLAAFWTLMVILLAGLTLFGMIFSRQIVFLFTNPVFRANQEQYDLAVTMTRHMFIYLFFIGLTALAMGIENSYQKFFAPAFHPVLMNLANISAVLIIAPDFFYAGFSAVIGVILGGSLQLALQLPFLWQVGMRFLPRFNFSHPVIRRIGALMVPSTFAVGIVQINTLIASYFLTAFPGARTQFFYSNRLTEFPYAIFSLPIATVILPTLSELAGRGEKTAVAQTLLQGLRLTAFIIIPASVGLCFIAQPLIHLIYEHGKFTPADTQHTARMLIMFCAGLWAVAGLRLVMQVFYAMEDMKTPVWSAAVGMVVNGAACWGLTRLPGVERAGVPLAISIAAMANLVLLGALLPRKVGRVELGGLGRVIGVSLLASLPMAALIWPIAHFPVWSHPGRIPLKLLLLLAMVAGGGLFYVLVVRLFRLSELEVFLDVFRSRWKRKPK